MTTTSQAPSTARPSPTSTQRAHGAGLGADAPAVEIRDLHKTFGSVRAVDGLDLTIRRGEVLAFLGPNGAGKSTTLDVVLGFSRPSSGTVRVLGSSSADAVAASRVSAVLQDGGLLPGYTVRQTLDVVASLQSRAPDVAGVVARTRLDSLMGRRVSRLSGGERQRLRLALALLPDPELLVLDEPTTGMDVTARAAFWDTMREETRGARRTVVFATHYLQEAADFADRIVIIDRGRLIADGTIDELQARQAATTVTATWPGLGGASEVRAALEPVASTLVSVEARGEHLEVRTTKPDDVARLLLTQTPARQLSVTPASLDDVFSALVERRTEQPATTPAGAPSTVGAL